MCMCPIFAFKISLEIVFENFKEIFQCFLNTISLLDTLGLMFVLLLLDADDPSSVKESAKKVGSLLGNNGLNLLVNNAGIVANGTIQTSRVEDMKNTFNTNVIGPFLIIRVMLCIIKS